jgi:hypothetical protein
VKARLYPSNLPANPTPEQLAPVNVEPIRETERPDAQPWQQVVEAEPVDTDGDGVREQQWKVEDRPLADVQAETLRSIRSQAESRLRPLLEEYTEPERLSWERQLAQARAYEADSNATTPLLDALATARGLSRQQMADKVIAAAEQFETQAGAIIGAQQAAEDAARNATTPEDAYKARNVDWPS